MAAICYHHMLLVLCVAIAAHASLPSVDLRTAGNHLKGQVCRRTAYQIQGALKGFAQRIEYEDFPKKPATVHSDSPCIGMEATCCLPEKEAEMMYLITGDYTSRLQTAFDKRAAHSCKIMGRNYERVLYNNLKQAMNHFKTEISGILQTNISNELFKEFGDYLYKFVYTRDFCPLRETTSNQIKKLFRYTYQLKLVQDPLQPIISNECLANLEEYYISIWQNDTLQTLMQSLNNIRLISESFDLIKSLVIDIRKHRWSSECASALFTIKHCAYCSGYTNFQPCDGNCLNAVRGCTADMADLNKHVHQLLEHLLKISKLIQSELRPIKLLQTVLSDYVKLAHQLAHANFTEMISSANCQIDEEKDQSYLEKIQRMPALQYVNVSTAMGTDNVLQSAIQNDIRCFKDLESLLVQLPEEMCGIDPNHLAYIRRKECWNGTARGSYMAPIVGPYKADQLTNPAFKYYPLSSNNTFHKQIANIHQIISDINRTLDYYQCFERDDEDCSTKFVLRCEIQPPTTKVTMLGSGSGSGSGYEIVTVPRDLERHKESSFVITLGGKRRFDDSYDDDKDTLPPVKIKTTPPIVTIKTTPTQSKTLSQVSLSQQTSSSLLTPATPPVITLPTKPIIIIERPQKQGSAHSSSPLLFLIALTILTTLYIVLL